MVGSYRLAEEDCDLAGDFSEAASGVEPVVIRKVLEDAAVEFGVIFVGRCQMGFDATRTQADAAVGDAEEVGEAGTGDEVGAVEKPQGVSQIVHAGL